MPVPIDTDEEPEDVVLDKLEFDEFKPWDVPPIPFRRKTTTNEDRIKKVENKKPKTQKTPEGRKRISTFPGWFARDGYLYDKYIYAPRHHANWRPKYRYPDGSTSWKSSKFIDGQLYDFFEGGDELDTSVVEVKEMRDEDEIQSYWDGYIEEPSNSGRTALRKDGSSPTLEDPMYGNPGLVIGGNY